MSPKRYSNIIGFDDAPFPVEHRGPVAVVGAVFAGQRLDGVLVGEVEKDGYDAARQLIEMVSNSKFAQHAQLLMLQGIALAGFNVVDVFTLHEELALPVLVVARRAPDYEAVRRALLGGIPGGAEKWDLIERLGPMQALGEVYVQRVGLTAEEAASAVRRSALHGHIPEPIRVAHLIAGAIGRGQSRGAP